ncbi:MAG: glycosyltransferase family 2 protein [Mucilaginibacter sp.]|uniref:glycosyltransferase family 2 protein n=1 Tax=Mucilaginibacter sp. TaxID=1882438 RepID=UPI0034E39386
MRVALCIPAYNAEKYLPQLLTSAQKQSIPFHEILVYDDCSTDNTMQVAEEHSATVIKGTNNQGCAFGKNVLANIAQSEWLHFHDADDDLLPNFTKVVNTWIENQGENFEILLLNFDYVDYHTKKLLGKADHDLTALHQDPIKYTIERCIINFGIYKRKSFLTAGGFNTDENVLYNEDNAFHQKLARLGHRFDYMPEITGINYKHIESMSASNQLKCAHANFYVLKEASEKVGNNYPQVIANQLWNCMTILGSFQDWNYVKKCILLLNNLNAKPPSDQNKVVSLIAAISPFYAIWIREKLIRLFKPNLRAHA